MVNTNIRLVMFFADQDGETLYSQQKNKTWSCLWLRSWAPTVKLRLKLKKVGKTIRPFRYDLSQIPFYTVMVMTSFKGVDLIDRVSEELT